MASLGAETLLTISQKAYSATLAFSNKELAFKGVPIIALHLHDSDPSRYNEIKVSYVVRIWFKYPQRPRLMQHTVL